MDALHRAGSGLAGARFIGALIGGGVALLLNTVVFPTNPLALIPGQGALRALAGSVRALNLTAHTPERVARERSVLQAAALANACLCSEQSLSVSVLIAQVRSVVADLLLALGLHGDEARRAIDSA